MKNQCNSLECKTEQASSGCICDESSNCPCCTTQNPIDAVVSMWHKAALNAMLEIKKEKLKEKLESAYGASIDKAADAVAEAVGKKLKSIMEQSESENELRNKLAKVMKEAFN